MLLATVEVWWARIKDVKLLSLVFFRFTGYTFKWFLGYAFKRYQALLIRLIPPKFTIHRKVKKCVK